MFKREALLFLKLCICSNVFADDQMNTYELFMPNVNPKRDESYFCSSIKIRDNFNVVGFQPRASRAAVQHIYVYGCSEPGSYESVWKCNMQRNEGDNTYKLASPCRSGPQMVFAWDRNTPSSAVLRLPDDVGFSVGANTSIKHLVLQVHYVDRLADDDSDNSGVVLNYTKKYLHRQAGVLLLGTKGVIPAHKVEYMETACAIRERKTIHPYAFRVQTNSLGKVVAGYVIRQEVEGDRWSLLGKKDPQLPQMFYPVVNTTPIGYGEVIAARCTMNNTQARAVRIGTKKKDEMCHYYLMYWIEDANPLHMKHCISPGPPRYYWTRAIERLDRIPHREASNL